MQILEWVKRQTGKLADNVKDYKFYVKSQPNFIDSSTTIILTTFNNRDQNHTIPCIYKWSKIKNGLISQVPEFKGNSFICEPSDIGAIVQVQITSSDVNHPGTAVLRFGPVKLDILIKKQMQHSLTTGSAVYNIDLLQKGEVKQCSLKITQQKIKISHSHSQNQYSFDYTIGQPRIQANTKQPTKVHIFFNQKHQSQIIKFTNSLFGFQQTQIIKQSNQKKLELQFPNRGAKDSFLLLVKAFNTKKAMKTSAIITKIQNSNEDISKNQNFNYVLQIQSLRADMVKLARLNDKFQSDKRTYYEQARRLQIQIEQIIVTYTKIIEGKCKDQVDLNQSKQFLFDKRDQFMQHKMNSLLRQNFSLRDKIQQMSDEMNRSTGHLVGNQGTGLAKSSSKYDQQSPSPSRGGFIKKRTAPQVILGSNGNILDNLNQPEIKEVRSSNQDRDKVYLAKKLNQQVAKNLRLEQTVRALKLNQTSIMDTSQISSTSNQQTRRLNKTSMDVSSPPQRQKFIEQIQQLRRKNNKLKEENVKLKSDLDGSRVLGQRMEEDLKSHKSGVSRNYGVTVAANIIPGSEVKYSRLDDSVSHKSYVSGQSQGLKMNPQVQRVGANNTSILNNSSLIANVPIYTSSMPQTHPQNCQSVQQLQKQNQSLKQQIQRLKTERDSLKSQISSMKKKISQLTNENESYKRSQDVLNRSQNLSMSMQDYNEQKIQILKQEVQSLKAQNAKLKAAYKKVAEELKGYRKGDDSKSNLDFSMSRDNIGGEKSLGEFKH